MRRTTAAVAAGALGLAALGGVGVGSALMTTAFAESTPESSTSDGADPSPTDVPSTGTDDDTSTDDSAADRLADRVSRITEALAGLVGAGTITQEQADAVAGTLAEDDTLRGGPGGHGHGHGGGFGVLHEGLETAATTLGITEDELRTQLEDGSTLGEIADEAGVDRATLVADLVAVAQAELAERVAAGDLTQERADEISADLQERVTEGLDREVGAGGRGFGHGGRSGPDDGDA
jgi:hypothetical protein